MKIGIDARTLEGERTGKGSYLFYLLKGLFEVDRENEYIIYHGSGKIDLKLAKNYREKAIKSPSFLWHLVCWYDFTFLEKVDLFFAPSSYIIPSFSKKCVIVVHDLVSFLNLTFHDRKAKYIERLTLKKALKNAKKVIAVSKNTKKDLQNLFKVSKEKIKVVYEAIDPIFYRKVEELEIKTVKEKYNLPDEYLLFVSTLEPRKNILRILKSYQLLCGRIENVPNLVMAGKKGWGTEEFFAFLEKMDQKSKIILPGHIDPRDLPALYQGALLSLFPSLYEGFGLTVLEAMASGLPVIASDTSSLPEVGEKAVLYVDPKNEEAISKSLGSLIFCKTLRKELSEKGKKQAKNFSINKQAREILEVIHEFES